MNISISSLKFFQFCAFWTYVFSLCRSLFHPFVSSALHHCSSITRRECNEIFPRVFPFHVISYCGFRAKCGCVRLLRYTHTLLLMPASTYSNPDAIEISRSLLLFHIFSSRARVSVFFKEIIVDRKTVCFTFVQIRLWFFCYCCYQTFGFPYKSIFGTRNLFEIPEWVRNFRAFVLTPIPKSLIQSEVQMK